MSGEIVVHAAPEVRDIKELLESSTIVEPLSKERGQRKHQRANLRLYTCKCIYLRREGTKTSQGLGGVLRASLGKDWITSGKEHFHGMKLTL